MADKPANAIDVSTSKVNDPQEPNVSSYFEYEVPASLEEAQKRFPSIMDNGKLVDPVYDLWKKGFVVAIQSPARLEVARQWESIPAERRLTLMERHEKDGVVSYTATLPDAQRELLQNHMANWKFGDRAPRVRIEYAGDPVEAFLAAAKDMTEERRAEVAAKVAEMLGISVPHMNRTRSTR